MKKNELLVLTSLVLTTIYAAGPGLGAEAPVRLFDLGTAKSSVYEGAAQITAKSPYSPEAGFGWQDGTNLAEQARVYDEMGDRRGSPAPPVMWTNPITEDSISSPSDSTFLVDLPDGTYRVYLLCGTSDPSPNQFWDFTVTARGTADAPEPATARVQIEEGQSYRPVRLEVEVRGGQLAIDLAPRSKWVVNCILISPQSEWARVEQEVIGPLEEWTFFLPPERQQEWKIDPPPEPEPMPELAALDRQRGWVLFSRPWPEVVWHNTRPRSEEINQPIRIFATPGEYEPLTICVHLLRPIGRIEVECSDLGPVAAATIDVRHVQYMRARPNYVGMGLYRIVPDVLEPMWMFHQREIFNPAAPVGLDAGVTHRFWLTVRVPDDAAPGLYHGSVTVTDERGNQAAVPVSLRVLPIQLRSDPAKIYGMYYRHPLTKWQRAPDEHSKQHWLRRAELEHADMAEHGMRNIVISAWCPEPKADGTIQPDWTLLEKTLDLCRQHGFTGPYATHINASGIYRKYVGRSWGSHCEDAEIPPPEYARDLTIMTQFIESERKKYGWPEFLYYPIDEPGRHAKSVELTRITLEAIRAAGAPTYVTAAPEQEAFQPLRPFVTVWCTQPFLPDRETVLADMAARDVQYWCYPNKSCGENDHTTVSGGRMTYGFGFWRSGFVALIPWIYSSTVSDPMNYLTGTAMDFLVRHEPDGTPMSVAIWESYREGYDDYRYIYTLEQLIAEARASGSAKAVAAAEQAERELQFVWDSIYVQPRYQYDDLWPAGDFNAYRWLIAEQIMAVQAAMKP
ncbi:MAG: hypothetical protein RBS80_09450 [Thermoguttaceae bacterium]|jgi:hypothetical protein|nr:hypothetical protein [Thermoguttaceae bacterium]